MFHIFSRLFCSSFLGTLLISLTRFTDSLCLLIIRQRRNKSWCLDNDLLSITPVKDEKLVAKYHMRIHGVLLTLAMQYIWLRLVLGMQGIRTAEIQWQKRTSWTVIKCIYDISQTQSVLSCYGLLWINYEVQRVHRTYLPWVCKWGMRIHLLYLTQTIQFIWFRLGLDMQEPRLPRNGVKGGKKCVMLYFSESIYTLWFCFFWFLMVIL